MLYIGIATLNHCDFLTQLRLCVSELTIILVNVTVAHNCDFMSHICDLISYKCMFICKIATFISHLQLHFSQL